MYCERQGILFESKKNIFKEKWRSKVNGIKHIPEWKIRRIFIEIKGSGRLERLGLNRRHICCNLTVETTKSAGRITP